MNEAPTLARDRGGVLSRWQRQAFAWPYMLWMAIFVVVPIALILSK